MTGIGSMRPGWGGGVVEHATWFAGCGGDADGYRRVPGVRVVHAANHNDDAIATHAANHPGADHRKDVTSLDVATLPAAVSFWASPECTQFTHANGKPQTYARCDTPLPGLEDPRVEAADVRSRALMWEVPRYLGAMAARGTPVLIGVVENVPAARRSAHWPGWVASIRALGYTTRTIALNSMHAQTLHSSWAPQSRDRLYVAYWHRLVGAPDWDKWLRPWAVCPAHGWVQGVQVFKRAGADMGAYRAQYVYRCPHVSCRGRVLDPPAAPAAAAIDWSDLGTPIKDRARPLRPRTLDRIAVGLRRYAGPVHLETGGNTYDATDPRHPRHGETDAYHRVWPVTDPLRTLHTTATKALLTPPGTTTPTGVPAGAFLAELRGGGSVARDVRDPLATITTSGNHHALITPSTRPGHGPARRCTPVVGPLRTIPTTGHQPLTTRDPDPAPVRVQDCGFRMLTPDEISAGMGFPDDYAWPVPTREVRNRLAGNAVTPNAAEILGCALVEALTGTDLPRWTPQHEEQTA